MYQFIAYIKFLTAASNQHGVHSPFVYNYVTKCLYSKQKLHKNKSKNVVLKSIAYFNAVAIFISDDAVKRTIQKKYANLNYNKEPVDFAYLSEPNLEKLKAIKYHNDTMVFVDNIYKNKETEQAWEHIKNDEEITVTIDLFYCAAVFFRKEQEKEHFKIRI